MLGVALDAVVEDGQHIHGQGMVSLVHLLQVEEYLPQERKEVAHDHRLGNPTKCVHENFVELVDRLPEFEAVIFGRVYGFSQEDVNFLEVVDGVAR